VAPNGKCGNDVGLGKISAGNKRHPPWCSRALLTDRQGNAVVIGIGSGGKSAVFPAIPLAVR
jgi:hypothetical protein